MKCTECNMENIDGALFCEECGAKLSEENELQETAVSTGAELVFAAADGTRFDLPVKDEVVIGREDPISEAFPDVDLTGAGGMEHGVSRRHAVLHHDNGDYTLEDLNSTNGTYVNKKRLLPHMPQAIKPGDEVRFGKLSLSIQAA